MEHKRNTRKRLLWLAIVLLVLPPLGMHQHVLWSGSGAIFDPQDAPTGTVALVLGASVKPDRQPSDMLRDRLLTASRLYQQGKIQQILVSGDHQPGEYDEVQVMARVLREQGVPATAIQLDAAGYRTLDSMYRARHVFGYEQVMVISNAFHVPRAVFLGQQFGMQVTGINATPGYQYSYGTQLRNAGREFLARIWAWGDVFILGTKPKELGQVPISQSGG